MTDEQLSNKEMEIFIAAWEQDRVDMMEPLVEKYGWNGLVNAFSAAVDDYKDAGQE